MRKHFLFISSIVLLALVVAQFGPWIWTMLGFQIKVADKEQGKVLGVSVIANGSNAIDAIGKHGDDL